MRSELTISGRVVACLYFDNPAGKAWALANLRRIATHAESRDWEIVIIIPSNANNQLESHADDGDAVKEAV